jgi:hypothetical protein
MTLIYTLVSVGLIVSAGVGMFGPLGFIAVAAGAWVCARLAHEAEQDGDDRVRDVSDEDWRRWLRSWRDGR